MPIEEVFQTLRCNPNGLTTDAAQERLEIFGHNKLEEKEVIFFGWYFVRDLFLFSFLVFLVFSPDFPWEMSDQIMHV